MTFLDMFEYVSEKEKADTINITVEEKPEENPEEIEENENFEMNEEE